MNYKSQDDVTFRKVYSTWWHWTPNIVMNTNKQINKHTYVYISLYVCLYTRWLWYMYKYTYIYAHMYIIYTSSYK